MSQNSFGRANVFFRWVVFFFKCPGSVWYWGVAWGQPVTEVQCCRIPRWVLYCPWGHREPPGAEGSLGFYLTHLLFRQVLAPVSSQPLLVDTNLLVPPSLEEQAVLTFPRGGL